MEAASKACKLYIALMRCAVTEDTEEGTTTSKGSSWCTSRIELASASTAGRVSSSQRRVAKAFREGLAKDSKA